MKPYSGSLRSTTNSRSRGTTKSWPLRPGKYPRRNASGEAAREPAASRGAGAAGVTVGLAVDGVQAGAAATRAAISRSRDDVTLPTLSARGDARRAGASILSDDASSEIRPHRALPR